MGMFCHQCQETAMNTGCTWIRGVCGKETEVANLQDLFIWTLKGISFWGTKANEEFDIYLEETGFFIAQGLFSTITNTNFDKHYFIDSINKSIALREELRNKYFIAKGKKCDCELPECVTWTPENSSDIEAKAESGIGGWLKIKDKNVRSLQATTLYGLKGVSAYLEHGYQISKEGGKEVFVFIMYALFQLIYKSFTVDEMINLALKTGEMGVQAMKYLDEANAHYGDTEITEVFTGVGTKPGILISGHNFMDLEDLLEQTRDIEIDVYSHSEMLPAHYRPFFKKYKNFIGNYGNAWYLQKHEFRKFNGPVILTSNCLVPPKEDYIDRIFTTGPVGYEGCIYIPDRPINGRKDFSVVIEKAKTCKPPEELENGKIVGGFGHKQVLALADKVIAAVKSGAIKRFVVMAGCDGRHTVRSYYTEVAKKLPKDTIILTAGCAKFRYIKEELGDIGGIPRVLDAGQCNDSYSLAVIALELQKAFELNDINDLPISFDIAWYDQKAVIVLLALLSLGVKGIEFNI